MDSINQALTPLGWMLATILISITAGIIGKYMGTADKVTESYCKEHRADCSKVIDKRLERIEQDIQAIFKLINDSFINPRKTE